MGTILVPDSLAIRRSLDVDEIADDKYEKPSEQCQEPEDNY